MAFQKLTFTQPGDRIPGISEVDDRNRNPSRRLPPHVNKSTADDFFGVESNLYVQLSGVRVERLPSHTKPGGTGNYVYIKKLCRRDAPEHDPETAQPIGGCRLDDLVGIRMVPSPSGSAREAENGDLGLGDWLSGRA